MLSTYGPTVQTLLTLRILCCLPAMCIQVRDGLLSVLQQHGVEVRTSARVQQITTAAGAVTGVRLASGEWIKTPLVITNR